jgi:hypothetical protein
VAPHISLACALPLRNTYVFLVLAIEPHINLAYALLGEAGLEAAFGAFCVKSCAQPCCPAATGLRFRCFLLFLLFAFPIFSIFTLPSFFFILIF